jgi:hypothetical protein
MKTAPNKGFSGLLPHDALMITARGEKNDEGGLAA